MKRPSLTERLLEQGDHEAAYNAAIVTYYQSIGVAYREAEAAKDETVKKALAAANKAYEETIAAIVKAQEGSK